MSENTTRDDEPAEAVAPAEVALQGWTAQQGGGPVGCEFVPSHDYANDPPPRVEFGAEADSSF